MKTMLIPAMEKLLCISPYSPEILALVGMVDDVTCLLLQGMVSQGQQNSLALYHHRVSTIPYHLNCMTECVKVMKKLFALSDPIYVETFNLFCRPCDIIPCQSRLKMHVPSTQ